jgi:hypothetical protein
MHRAAIQRKEIDAAFYPRGDRADERLQVERVREPRRNSAVKSLIGSVIREQRQHLAS